MSSTERIAATVRERLQGTLEPLRNELAEVERRMEEMNEELGELKTLRTELRRMLAVIDPTVPIRGRKTQNGPGPGDAAAKKAIGDAARRRHAQETAEKRKRLEDWIDAYGHRHPEGFTRQDILANVKIGENLLSRMLDELTTAGVIRLDHINDMGRRFYKPLAVR